MKFPKLLLIPLLLLIACEDEATGPLSDEEKQLIWEEQQAIYDSTKAAELEAAVDSIKSSGDIDPQCYWFDNADVSEECGVEDDDCIWQHFVDNSDIDSDYQCEASELTQSTGFGSGVGQVYDIRSSKAYSYDFLNGESRTLFDEDSLKHISTRSSTFPYALILESDSESSFKKVENLKFSDADELHAQQVLTDFDSLLYYAYIEGDFNRVSDFEAKAETEPLEVGDLYHVYLMDDDDNYAFVTIMEIVEIITGSDYEDNFIGFKYKNIGIKVEEINQISAKYFESNN